MSLIGSDGATLETISRQNCNKLGALPPSLRLSLAVHRGGLGAEFSVTEIGCAARYTSGFAGAPNCELQLTSPKKSGKGGSI